MQQQPASSYAPVPGKIPGTPINLGGVEFILPPLNLDGVQAYLGMQDEMQSVASDMPALFKLVAHAVHLALVRNYPDLTVAELVALLDMRTVVSAPKALAEVSGLQVSGESTPAPQ